MFRTVVVSSAVVIALLSSGCAGPSGGGSEATGKPISVIAGFYPLQFAAETIGGGQVDVTTLTAPGVEPHDLELTPQQVVQIQEADLVLYIPGFQPAVDAAIEAEAPTRGVDVTAGITLLSGEQNSADPHIWLNPQNMTTIGRTVATRLAALRPTSTSVFTANGDALGASMSALNDRWAKATTTCASRDLVVSHEAFGYLAQQYGLTQVAISGLAPDSEPAPSVVARVADFVRANDVKTIYYETLVDPKVATVLAQETGAATAVLDPIEGIPAGSAATYTTLMDANLAAVVAGQPCR